MVINLHDISGQIVEVDTLALNRCTEQPDFTELEIMQRVQGLSRYPTVKEIKIQVMEKREEIRKLLLENREITPTIPQCLLHERKSFEQLRAERRAKQTNT